VTSHAKRFHVVVVVFVALLLDDILNENEFFKILDFFFCFSVRTLKQTVHTTKKPHDCSPRWPRLDWFLYFPQGVRSLLFLPTSSSSFPNALEVLNTIPFDGLQTPTDIFLFSSLLAMHSPEQSECLYYSQFTGKVFNVCKRTVRPSHDDHDLFIIIIDLRVECPIESKSKRISMASATKNKKKTLSTCSFFVCVNRKRRNS